MLEDRPIAAGRAVVGLVNHNVIVEVAPNLLPKPAGGEHTDGTEQMLQSVGLVGADLQFAKVLVAQDVAESAQRLLKNLLPVR